MNARFFSLFIVLATFISLASLVPTFQPSATAAPAQNAVNVELLGHIGGSTRAVAARGSYTYVGIGPRLAILNVSDPANPRLAGQSAPLPGIVKAVVLAGNYAYVVVGDGGLRILDVSNRAAPREVGFYDAARDVSDVVVSGNYAYVATADDESTGGNLRVLDVTDPTAPTEVGIYENLSGGDAKLAIKGTLVYILSSSQLSQVDVSTPSAPTYAGTKYTPSDSTDFAIVGNYLYLTTPYFSDAGLHIYDVSDPRTMPRVGFLGTDSYPVSLIVNGNYAYLAEQWVWNGSEYEGGGVRVVDVSTPSTPTEVLFHDTPGSTHQVAVREDKIYSAEGTYGLRVLDANLPTDVAEISAYNPLGSVVDVSVAGNRAHLTSNGNLHIFDVSDPSTPVQQGFFDVEGGAGTITVDEERVYIYSYDNNGSRALRILNNPANATTPSEIGSFDLQAPVADIAAVGNLIYLAEWTYGANDRPVGGGLRILDVATPSAPTELSFYDVVGGAYDVVVSDTYAYVIGNGGLTILDVSDPREPTVAGSYDIGDSSPDLAIEGNFAYIGHNVEGLKIVDVSNPEKPVRVGAYSTHQHYYYPQTNDVAVQGNYVYINIHTVDRADRGLHVLNVEDPTSPREVGFYPLPGQVTAVTVTQDRAYVNDGEGGLYILRFQSGSTPTPTSTVTRTVTSTPDGTATATRTPTATATQTPITPSRRELYLPLILRR